MLQAANLSSPVHLIRLPQNKGITEALNAGLKWILEHTHTRYIARLDCGDTCHPERFLLQVGFLDTHPDVGLLGTWCTFQAEDGSFSYPYTTPLDHDVIIKEMHLRNVFIHPTVMLRRQALLQVGVYPYEYPHAEDYALFWALLQVSKGAILDRKLVTCVINAAGISMGNRKKQLKSRLKVVLRLGNRPGLKVLTFVKINLLLFVPQRFILWWRSR
jgi:glycosyltransferase involved in cell wall biosynthesis